MGGFREREQEFFGGGSGPGSREVDLYGRCGGGLGAAEVCGCGRIWGLKGERSSLQLSAISSQSEFRSVCLNMSARCRILYRNVLGCILVHARWAFSIRSLV